MSDRTHENKRVTASKHGSSAVPTAAVPTTSSGARSSPILNFIVRHYALLAAFAGMGILYMLAILLIPSEPAPLHPYHIGTVHLTLLTLAIYVPFVCVWIVPLVGYLHLRDYARLIQDEPDGRAFQWIARGVFSLSLWLPLTSVTTLIVTFSLAHHVPNAGATQSTTFINLAILLTAFGLLYYGSRKLLATTGRATELPLWVMLAFIVASAVYCYLVFQDASQEVSTAHTSAVTYYLPTWTILITLIIPRLLYWYLGLRAAYNLFAYRLHVPGKIYRQALGSLALGLVSVIMLTVLYRTLTTATIQPERFTLPRLALVSYLLLVALAAGYFLVARGASKLRRLEEL